MIYLLLDSSDTDLIVGISEDEKLIYQTSFYAWQRQSELMIPEIEKALKTVNMELKDIDYVCLGIGPGSYTGVRIPLTIAKTLNILNNTKIIPLSSLMIMGTKKEKYISLMNARGNRSYIGIYEYGKNIIPDQVMDNNSVINFIQEYLDQGFVIKGNVSYLFKEEKNETNILEGLVSYAKNGEVSNTPLSLKPVYLKD